MTTWDKLAICNLAFNVLNKNSVDDLVNAGEFANSASAAFDLLYPSSISGKSWRFATKIQLLNLLVTPPPITRWSYMLQLPTDYLAAVRTYPAMDFNLFGDKMYANNKVVQLEYRFLPDPTDLPAYFVHWFALVIAEWFADAVAENDTLAEKLAKKADKQLGEALFTDSQSHPISAMGNNPLVQARYGGWYGCDRPGDPGGNPF
jgi:hypothetical protein